MLKRQTAWILALALMVPVAPAFSADDTVGEKVEEAVNDAGRGASKAGRKMKKAACEMVDGKCVKETVKGKAKDVKGDVEDALD